MNYKTILKTGLLSTLGLVTGCSTQNQAPSRYNQRIWLTPEIIQETSLARVIPQNDLERSLVADIDVFYSEKGCTVETVMRLTIAGYELSSSDYDGEALYPRNNKIYEAFLYSWDARRGESPAMVSIIKKFSATYSYADTPESFEAEVALQDAGQRTHDCILKTSIKGVKK